jgi:hypothetical protein
MAHNSGVQKKSLDIALRKASHLEELEICEPPTKVLPFAQDGEPTQTGLKSLEADFLEEAAIIGDRVAPFFVVVATIVLGGGAPPTTRNTVLASHNAATHLEYQ